MYVCISTPSTRKGSHAESKASHGRKWRFFSNVLNSLLVYYTWFRKPIFCVQTMSEQYLEKLKKVIVVVVVFGNFK